MIDFITSDPVFYAAMGSLLTIAALVAAFDFQVWRQKRQDRRIEALAEKIRSERDEVGS